MIVLIGFCWAAMAQVDAYQTGDRLFAEGQYLMAEGHFLAAEPLPGEVPRVAERLCEIALRTGNIEGKRTFFKSYLSKKGPWRGVALFTLAGLAMHERNWEDFQYHSRLFFQEYGPLESPIALRFLYHMARYTTLSPEPLPLSPLQRRWFEACRGLSADKQWPLLDSADLPYGLRYGRFLEADRSFDPPSPAAGPTREDRYFHLLLQIRASLLKDDLNEAAAAINKLTPLDREMNRSDLSLHFYPLFSTYFEKRQQPDKAAVAKKNLAVSRRWAVLPLVLLPDHLKTQPPPGRSEPVSVAESPKPEDEAGPVPVAESPQPGEETGSEPVAESPKPEDEAPVPVAEMPEKGEETGTEPVAETPEAVDEARPEPVAEVVPKPVAERAADPRSVEPEDTGDRVPVAASFEDLERQLLENHRGMELKIRAKQPDTPFKRIYKNYLLGTYYLESGRMREAYEQLSLAEQKIYDYPFPTLECKVLLALAGYYERKKDADKADWYRIAAVQIWNAPENLPIFVNQKDQVQISPYPALLDQILQTATDENRLHQLIYYNELAHFHDLRRRAYRRNALSSNAVLGDQLQQIGSQLHRLIHKLAEQPASEESPKRYNDTVEIWNQLWPQTLAYYRSNSVPSAPTLQNMLNQKDRLLAFVEGETQWGVLVFSKTQALAVSLGNIANYRYLSDEKKLDYLEARLGPIWKQEGPLFLMVSPSLKSQGFFTMLKQRMRDPSQLVVIFSLKSFAAEKEVSLCRNISVISDTAAPPPAAFIDNLQQPGLNLYTGALTSSRIGITLESHDHLIYFGDLTPLAEGLVLGRSGNGFRIHEIVHHNPRLCSLILISEAIQNWPALMNELELVSPQSSVSIFLGTRAETAEPPDLGQRRFGIRFL